MLEDADIEKRRTYAFCANFESLSAALHNEGRRDNTHGRDDSFDFLWHSYANSTWSFCSLVKTVDFLN